MQRPPLPSNWSRGGSHATSRASSPASSIEDGLHPAFHQAERAERATARSRLGLGRQVFGQGVPDDSGESSASDSQRPYVARRRTEDGRSGLPFKWAEDAHCLREDWSEGEAGAARVSNLMNHPLQGYEVGYSHDGHTRRMSMPGEMPGPSFSFPALGQTSNTVSGSPASGHHQRSISRLGIAASVPMSALDAAMAAAYHHAGSGGGGLGPGSANAAYPIHSPHLMSPMQPLSRATTPLQSGMPTPRSSMTGSVYGSPSEAAFHDVASTDRGRALRRALSSADRGLDTPVWVAHLRLLGRLLLAALFANLLWQELREWRTMKGHGWREWYDLSWMSEEMPPLPVLLSCVALLLLLAGLSTSVAAGYLAARLLVQSAEQWEEIFAVLQEQTSNLLPVKELAVVGTVIVFIGHTYFVPDWVRGSARAKVKGKATGLMYTQQWRPGQSLVILLGRLLVAPLFVSICALQYYDMTASASALDRWWQRLLHRYYWLPPGDSSTNNWLPAQAAAYVLLITGMSNKRVPALLAALLVAEAFTCWRFWSSVWLSKHYVCYLRRHFTANLAIAGGLLLNLPQGRHDASAVVKEAAAAIVGKKRT